MLTPLLVRWHYRASSTIDSLVPHPQEDTFALFLRPSSTAPQGTQIVIFRPTACVPASIHSVPFGLRGVSWYSLNRTPSAFSLVGITGEWAVVLLGDRVHLAKEEGSAARGLAAHSAPQQRTLFQDIFGKSAFTTTPGDQSLQTQPITARLSTSRAVVGMFDGPAYLMPPLETLFDSLMGEFLKQRLDNAPISTEPIQEEDNDVDMDDETGPIIIGTQSTRVVNRAEIEALVSIFKKHTVKRKSKFYFAYSTANGVYRQTNISPQREGEWCSKEPDQWYPSFYLPRLKTKWRSSAPQGAYIANRYRHSISLLYTYFAIDYICQW